MGHLLRRLTISPMVCKRIAPILVAVGLCWVPIAHAETSWAPHYVEAKYALRAGDFAACLNAIDRAYEAAPADRRPNIAAVGARCAAGSKDRDSFATWSQRAGKALQAAERRKLEAKLPPPKPVTPKAAPSSQPKAPPPEPAPQRSPQSPVAEGTKALEEFTPPATPPATRQEPTASKDAGTRSVGSVWLSSALGAVVANGTTYRGHANLELGGAWHLGFVRLDLALASTVEPPILLTVRPGVRAFLGPMYGRMAFQFAAALDGSGEHPNGALLGLGGEVGLGKGWFLMLEADASLWFRAISVVPIEGRVGLEWGW